jgi:hypothetical protein
MTNPADKVEKWDISKLVPYARNSRTHSDEQISQIAASIKEWGWTTPVLVDENGSIIAGHGRTLAAQRLKMTKVPVMVAKGWSDAKKRAYVIADNKLAMNAGWDNELLALELGELGDLGFDLDLTGFTDDEIAALMPEQIEPGLTDEDAVPELPEQPVTVLGDVWVLGKHRLMCGDCKSFSDIDKLCIKRELYVFDLVLAHVRDWGWNFADEFCWERSGIPQQVARRFKNQFEPIYHFTMGEWKFYPDAVKHESKAVPKARGKGAGNTNAAMRQGHVSAVDGNDIAAGMAYPGNRLPTFQSEALGHPAAYPVGLPEFFIKAYTDSGDVVFDPFMGSGSTLMAAEKNGRIAFGTDLIIKRWQDFTGKIAIHAETGEPFAEVTNGKNT